jgi:hypothetical protein
MAQAPVRAKQTTPKGTFVYPYLVKPDHGNDKFPDHAGSYKVNLKMTEEQAAPLLAILQPIYNECIQSGTESFNNLKIESRKKLKSLSEIPLYVTEYDEVTEEPTGNILFKFATKASGINAKGDAWTRTLPIFDASGKSFKPASVMGGTTGKVSFEAAPYFIPGTGSAGVKLYLNAVQIISLSETGSGGGSGTGFGFAKEEGYTAEEELTQAQFSADADDDNF